jgi:hypothetical protein
MSWDELSAKAIEHLGGADPEPYFTGEQIAAARELLAQAQSRASEREGAAPVPAPGKVKERLRSR